MTGYEITKSIFSFSSENPKVKSNHISTFIYFGEISNECNWVPLIEISREKLLKIAGIGTQRTYKKILDDLVNWNAVKVHHYSTNQFNPYDVIEIDQRFVKKAKSLLNHYEFNAVSEQKPSNDIYIKTNKPLNLKTNNDMEVFFEENDFLKYKNLKIDNQKLIKENLKIILKQNFELLSNQDLSQVEFEIKFRGKIGSNFNENEKKVVEDIQDYFGINELNNFRLFDIVNQFVQYLSQSNLLELFDENFSFYRKYKEMTGQTQHSFERFIGTTDKKYEDGVWQSENFKNKVKQFENNQFFSARQKGKKVDENDLKSGKNNVLRRLGNE